MPVAPLEYAGIAIEKQRIVARVSRTRPVIELASHPEKSKPAPFTKTVKDAAPTHQ